MINIDNRLLAQINPDELYLLCHIVNYMNQNKMCFPSNGKLIKDSGFSQSKILRVKNTLIDKKIMTVTQRFRADGSQTSNLYKLQTDYIGVYVSGKNMSDLNTALSKYEQGEVFTDEHDTYSKVNSLEVLTNRSIKKNKVLNNINTNVFIANEEINQFSNFSKVETQSKVNPFSIVSQIEKEKNCPKKEKAEPTERKPNPTYEAFTIFCQTFERLSGANYPKDKNGNYLMNPKDAGGMVYLMKNIEKVDRNENSIEALKVFVTAAWNLNDKWIRANFTPNTLYGQFSKIFTGYQTISPEMIEKKKNDRIAELLAEKMKQYENQ